MKLVTVIGARPQFIKAAVVSRALQKYENIEEVIVHTGQHYDPDMSEIFFSELSIPKPKFNLNVSDYSHAEMTARMMMAVEDVFYKVKPDLVMVYGDTNSTLAASLVASKLHIPVAHVEAGLRSFNKSMPEEINRILTDHVSSYLFAPTKDALKNLQNEGFAKGQVFEVGDVMYDATKLFYDPTLENRFGKNYILTTLHRAENTNDLEILQKFLREIGQVSHFIPVIFPIHPRTKKIINRNKLTLDTTGSLRVINPVGYKEMLSLIANSLLVLTDSGGLQKEAYFMDKKCVTYRNETEWTELIDVGWNKLIKPNTQSFTRELIDEFLAENVSYSELYGGGNASSKIASILFQDFGAENVI